MTGCTVHAVAVHAHSVWGKAHGQVLHEGTMLAEPHDMLCLGAP